MASHSQDLARAMQTLEESKERLRRQEALVEALLRYSRPDQDARMRLELYRIAVNDARLVVGALLGANDPQAGSQK